MSFDLARSLRRLKPQRQRIRPHRRGDAALPWAHEAPAGGPPLLLDTTVYIDALQKRLPDAVKALMASRAVEHSAIALGELAHALGRLDPNHPGTPATLGAVKGVIAAVPPYRLSMPSVQATIEAGILAGTLARLRGLPKAQQQPLFNDAALLLQALERGYILLSRNIADMDELSQLLPQTRLLLYR